MSEFEMKPSVFTPLLRDALNLMKSTAQEKGYNLNAEDKDYGEQLTNFVSREFPGHHLGEIVYKAIRYKNQKNPRDLAKIIAWACLVWIQDGHDKLITFDKDTKLDDVPRPNEMDNVEVETNFGGNFPKWNPLPGPQTEFMNTLPEIEPQSTDDVHATSIPSKELVPPSIPLEPHVFHPGDINTICAKCGGSKEGHYIPPRTNDKHPDIAHPYTSSGGERLCSQCGKSVSAPAHLAFENRLLKHDFVRQNSTSTCATCWLPEINHNLTMPPSK